MSLGTGWNYTHLSGAGTTTILAGIGAANNPGNAGLFGGVIINTAGTSVTIQDGSGNTLAAYGAITGDFSRTSGILLKNGLVAVIVGAADVTVLWA